MGMTGMSCPGLELARLSMMPTYAHVWQAYQVRVKLTLGSNPLNSGLHARKGDPEDPARTGLNGKGCFNLYHQISASWFMRQ